MNRLFLALGITLIAGLAMAQERVAPAPDAQVYFTDEILHFGKGQTETTLPLSKGRHTLQIVFADYLHNSFDPPLHSPKITITVE